MPEIVIRLILESDAAGFHALLDSVARERRYLGALEAPPFAQLETFVQHNARNRLPHFVAVDPAAGLVGWCDALPGSAAAGAMHIARLGMGVHRDHRGRGLGRRLMEATIALCRSTELEKIELSVYSSNAIAIALYRKLGFVEEGRKWRGRIVDGIVDDVVLMALDLRPAS